MSKVTDVRVLPERLHQLIDMAYFFSSCGTPTSYERAIALHQTNLRVIEMKNVFKKLVALTFTQVACSNIANLPTLSTN